MRVFVVSTGRTGTAFLADAFSEVGVNALHEPGPRWLRNISNAYAAGMATDRLSRRVVRRYRGSIDDSSSSYLEASCLIYSLGRPISEEFEEAVVIHMVRNPLTYVQSAIRWGVHRLGGRPLNVVPFRRLSPVHSSDHRVRVAFRWATMSQFDRVCWTWTKVNRFIRENPAKRQITLRFEDVFDARNGYPGLVRIASILDMGKGDTNRLLARGADRLNESRQERGPGWTEWPDERLRALASVCGNEALNYGYDVQKDAEIVLRSRR